MKVYLSVAYQTSKRFLFYPHEMIAMVVRRLIEIGFLVLFWSVVARSSPTLVNTNYLVSYFLISGGLNDILMVQQMRFTQFIQKVIKNGQLSNYLIKPVASIPYLYASDLGQVSVSLLLGVVSISAGVWVHPPESLATVALFLLFVIPAFCISISINLLAGMCAFYTPEAQNIRFIFGHISKVFAGAIVPLQFFPQTLRYITLLTPFPYMLYIPVSILKGTITSNELIPYALIGVVWTLLLLLATQLLWRYSLKHYDAVGL